MIVILGGGLAGLATAWFLGDRPHVVLEAESAAGGLCRTRVVDGFHFDYTGHLLHLRDPRVERLVEEWLPGVFRVIERRASIRTRGVTLPFPFQANLHGLPREVVADCLVGFVEALGRDEPRDPAVSFRDWSLAVLGSGISEAFMFPYNAKLFRRDPSEMTADWVSWAIPRPKLREIVDGALGVVNRGLGYNATFRYPARGGIEVLPNAFAERLASIRLGVTVDAVDVARHVVVTSSGEEIPFDRVVSTVPLPALLRMVRGLPGDLEAEASRLDWSVVGCLNLGFDRPGIGEGAHWVYCPDADAPFYRVGFPTNITDGAAPRGTSSAYVEFGLRRGETHDPQALATAAIEHLRREGVLRAADRVVVRDWVTIDPGYVIFDRARQEVMARVVPELDRHGVHVAGRYGAWTYSYMERAILDGLEIASRLRGQDL